MVLFLQIDSLQLFVLSLSAIRVLHYSFSSLLCIMLICISQTPYSQLPSKFSIERNSWKFRERRIWGVSISRDYSYRYCILSMASSPARQPLLWFYLLQMPSFLGSSSIISPFVLLSTGKVRASCCS